MSRGRPATLLFGKVPFIHEVPMLRVALALAFLSAPALAADPVSLTLKIAPESKVSFRSNGEVKQSMQLMGQTFDTTITTDKVFALVGRGTQEDGSFLARIENGAIRGKQIAPPMAGGTTEFDSENKAEGRDPMQGAMADLNVVDANTTIDVRLSPAGEFLEAKGLGAQVKPKLDAAANAAPILASAIRQSQEKMSDEHTKQQLRSTLLPLPKQALTEGAEFKLAKGYHECSAGNVCSDIDLNCKVLSVKDDAVTIEFKAERAAPADLDPDLIEGPTVESQKIAGTWVIDRKDGLPRTLVVEKNTKLLMPGPQGTMAITVADKQSLKREG